MVVLLLVYKAPSLQVLNSFYLSSTFILQQMKITSEGWRIISLCVGEAEDQLYLLLPLLQQPGPCSLRPSVVFGCKGILIIFGIFPGLWDPKSET